MHCFGRYLGMEAGLSGGPSHNCKVLRLCLVLGLLGLGLLLPRDLLLPCELDDLSTEANAARQSTLAKTTVYGEGSARKPVKLPDDV
jgi:hypothetical protein